LRLLSLRTQLSPVSSLIDESLNLAGSLWNAKEKKNQKGVRTNPRHRTGNRKWRTMARRSSSSKRRSSSSSKRRRRRRMMTKEERNWRMEESRQQPLHFHHDFKENDPIRQVRDVLNLLAQSFERVHLQQQEQEE